MVFFDQRIGVRWPGVKREGRPCAAVDMATWGRGRAQRRCRRGGLLSDGPCIVMLKERRRIGLRGIRSARYAGPPHDVFLLGCMLSFSLFSRTLSTKWDAPLGRVTYSYELIGIWIDAYVLAKYFTRGTKLLAYGGC
jgi:hypothetical protein